MRRVLVVEDEIDIRQVFAYNLGQAGHEVVTADRGEAALTSVRDARPDIVLESASWSSQATYAVAPGRLAIG